MSAIIIFGLSSSGLFLLRELSKIHSNVIGIGKNNDFGRFSKCGTKYVANTHEELREVIARIIYQCDEKPQGIIASGYYLTMMVDEMPEIFDMIDINGPGVEALKILNDKFSSYSLLKSYNISVPRSYKISEVDSISENEFPMILKWSTTELNHCKRVIEKTKVIGNRLELMYIISEIDISDTKLILQDYIIDEQIEEYGYGGYFENGIEKADIVVNGMRQYPMGIYTFAREVEDNECTQKIRSQLGRMLQSINYTGFIHFDIKVDCSKGEYYILDINPRPWNSISILKKKYPNFIEVLAQRDVQLTKRAEIIQWVDIITDLLSIMKRFMKSKSVLSLYKDFSEYFKYDTIINVFQYNDIKPTIGWVWISVRKLCNSFMCKIHNF